MGSRGSVTFISVNLPTFHLDLKLPPALTRALRSSSMVVLCIEQRATTAETRRLPPEVLPTVLPDRLDESGSRRPATLRAYLLRVSHQRDCLPPHSRRDGRRARHHIQRPDPCPARHHGRFMDYSTTAMTRSAPIFLAGTELHVCNPAPYGFLLDLSQRRCWASFAVVTRPSCRFRPPIAIYCSTGRSHSTLHFSLHRSETHPGDLPGAQTPETTGRRATDSLSPPLQLPVGGKSAVPPLTVSDSNRSKSGNCCSALPWLAPRQRGSLS